MPEGRSCKIILGRHGETEANRSGCFAACDEIELTDRGKAQAHALALELRQRFRPAFIFTSPFVRARQTAEIVARELDLTVQILPGIHERDFGSLKGAAHHVMGRQMQADPTYDTGRRWLWSPVGGESLDQVRERVVQKLKDLAASCLGQEVIVVSHGAVMECVAAELASGWDQAAAPENCAILVFECDGARLTPSNTEITVPRTLA